MVETSSTDHPSFPQPGNIEIKVWRYMDLAKFIWLLKHKSLFMTALSKLRDSHEGATTKIDFEIFSNFINRNPNPNGMNTSHIQNSMSDTFKGFKDSTFINCWTMSNVESEAMWKLYCPNDTGISIQSTYSKLASQINDQDTYIGLVSYIDYENQSTDKGGMVNIYNRFMHKRLSFKHESEVRIVKILHEYTPQYMNGVNQNEKTPPSGIEMEINLIELIDNVYINPYADECFYDSTKSIIECLCPELLQKMKWSYMKSEPLF